MPSHSVHIEALLKVFPDARLIWAHRDPYKATGSLCNLWRLPKSLVMDTELLDQTAMGRNAMGQMRYHVDRPLRARDRIGDDRFFHMYYHEMMRDPMDVMRRIYDWAGRTADRRNRSAHAQLARRAPAGPVRAQRLQPRPIRPERRDSSNRSSPSTSTPSTSNWKAPP